MKTLAEIFEKATEVVQHAKRLGFSNVRVYDHRRRGESHLNLITSLDKENKAASNLYAGYLGFDLRGLLDCQVTIVPEERIDPLEQKEFLEHSAILEKAEVEKLFGLSLDQIGLDPPKGMDPRETARWRTLVQQTQQEIAKVSEEKAIDKKVEVQEKTREKRKLGSSTSETESSTREPKKAHLVQEQKKEEEKPSGKINEEMLDEIMRFLSDPKNKKQAHDIFAAMPFEIVLRVHSDVGKYQKTSSTSSTTFNSFFQSSLPAPVKAEPSAVESGEEKTATVKT